MDITQEELLRWGKLAVSESWEHIAIQKLLAALRDDGVQPAKTPAPKLPGTAARIRSEEAKSSD